MKTKNRIIQGFTIIELMAVIFIIGSLAAVMFVSYGNTRKKATVTSLQSDLSNAADKLVIDQANLNSSSGNFATDLSETKWSSGTTTSYTVNNTVTPKTFCITATKDSQSYFITLDGRPLFGICPMLYLDPSITSSYSGSGASWYDLSGGGHHATISGGVTFDDTNDSLVFDGTGSATYVSGGFLPSGTSPRTIAFWFKANAGMSGSNGAFSYGCTATESLGCSDAGQGKYVSAYATTSSTGLHLGTCQVSGITTPSPTTGWHYFTAVFNSNGTTITFYIDGGTPTTRTPGCTVNTNSGKGYAVGVGRWGYYNGAIGDLRVYSSALSASDIGNIYTSQKARFGL